MPSPHSSSSSRGQRVVIYAAESSPKESITNSRESQIARLRQDAELRGQQVVAVFEEAGYKGILGRGPARRACLAMLEAGEAEVLKVVSMSRLSRSLRGMLELVERVHGWGVVIEVLDEAWEFASAQGRFVAGMMGALNQYWAEITSEKAAIKTAERLQAGMVSGASPYGYRRRLDAQGRSTGYLEPEPAEAAVLLHLCDWLEETGSVGEAVLRASQAGYRTRRSARRGGKNFTWTTLQRLLSQRVLLGEVRSAGQWRSGPDGPWHEPLLDAARFDRLQALLFPHAGSSAGAADRANLQREWLLGGLVWCGQSREATDPACGSWLFERMESDSTKKRRSDPLSGAELEPLRYFYYTRVSRKRRVRGSELEVLGCAPDFGRIRAADLEERVLDIIARLALDEAVWGWAETAAAQHAAEGLAALAVQRGRIAADYAALEQRQRVLEDKVEALAGSPGSQRAIESLDGKLRACDAEAGTLDQMQADCDKAEAWYGSLTLEVAHLRRHFLAVVGHRRAGRPRALRHALQRVLAKPYGVVVYNGGRLELNLHLGQFFETRPGDLVEVEKWWRIQPSSTNFVEELQERLRRSLAA